MKYLLLILLCLFFLCPLLAASEADTDRAAQVLVRALQKRGTPITYKVPGCACGADCTCVSGDCGDPNCPSLTKRKVSTKTQTPGEWLLYEVRYAQALKANKPLLIWVGEACPPCEAKWTDFVHAHLSEYDGNKGKEVGPEVIIAKPDGLGGMDIKGRIDGIPTKLAIDAMLRPRSDPRDDPTYDNVNPYNHNPHWPYQSRLVMPPPMPMMRPMMPMMGFGGFGGGFCGGGGCGPSG